MSELGNRLLYSVSAQRETTYARFSQIFDALYGQLRARRAEAIPVAVIRRRTLAVLEQLGHAELEIDGNRVIGVFAAEAVLNRLPVTGNFRFVLAGRRSPDTIERVKQSVREFRGACRLTVGVAELPVAYSPDVIEIECEGIEIARAISERSELHLATRPAAWDILDLSPSIAQYRERLSWIVEDELNWERRDFSIDTYKYGPPIDTTDLRLSRYSDGSGFRFRNYLRKGTERADVDPEWGKHILLLYYGVCPLAYDSGRGVLSVPVTVGLPRYLARAASFCSGTPAVPQDSKALEGGPDFLSYRDVPNDVFQKLSMTLGY